MVPRVVNPVGQGAIFSTAYAIARRTYRAHAQIAGFYATMIAAAHTVGWSLPPFAG